MHAGGRFESLSAAKVGVQHLADDGSGSDDRDLNDDVVEASRAQARERGHLRAALHLEEPDRVGFLERVVDLLIVLRKMREIDLDVAVALNEAECVFEYG